MSYNSRFVDDVYADIVAFISTQKGDIITATHVNGAYLDPRLMEDIDAAIDDNMVYTIVYALASELERDGFNNWAASVSHYAYQIIYSMVFYKLMTLCNIQPQEYIREYKYINGVTRYYDGLRTQGYNAQPAAVRRPVQQQYIAPQWQQNNMPANNRYPPQQRMPMAPARASGVKLQIKPPIHAAGETMNINAHIQSALPGVGTQFRPGAEVYQPRGNMPPEPMQTRTAAIPPAVKKSPTKEELVNSALTFEVLIVDPDETLMFDVSVTDDMFLELCKEKMSVNDTEPTLIATTESLHFCTGDIGPKYQAGFNGIKNATEMSRCYNELKRICDFNMYPLSPIVAWIDDYMLHVLMYNYNCKNLVTEENAMTYLSDYLDASRFAAAVGYGKEWDSMLMHMLKNMADSEVIITELASGKEADNEDKPETCQEVTEHVGVKSELTVMALLVPFKVHVNPDTNEPFIYGNANRYTVGTLIKNLNSVWDSITEDVNVSYIYLVDICMVRYRVYKDFTEMHKYIFKKVN